MRLNGKVLLKSFLWTVVAIVVLSIIAWVVIVLVLPQFAETVVICTKDGVQVPCISEIK